MVVLRPLIVSLVMRSDSEYETSYSGVECEVVTWPDPRAQSTHLMMGVSVICHNVVVPSAQVSVSSTFLCDVRPLDNVVVMYNIIVYHNATKAVPISS